jgi:hypothetical protein
MNELATDGRGNFKYRDAKSGKWEDAPVSENKETGEFRAYNGAEWVPITMPSSESEMERRAASLDPIDLSVARSKRDQFGEYLRSRAKVRRPDESEWERGRRLYGGIGIPSQGEAGLRSFLKGGALGYGDELVAAATSALGGRPYSDELASERWRLKAGESEHPGTATTAEIGGALASPATIGVAKLAAVPATTGGRVLAGGLLGGGEAAVYGSGVGEGGIVDRAFSAIQHAPFGLLAGAAGPVMAKGIGDAYEAIKNRLLASRVKAGSSPAAALVRDVMKADETFGGVGERRLAAAGEGAMLAEAGPASEALLDTAIQMSGRGGTKAIQEVDKRVGAASEALKKTLNKYLGNVEGIMARARFNSRSTSKARGDAYGKAYNTPINYAGKAGRDIEGVLDLIPDRIKADAFRLANEDMVQQGLKNKQIMFDVADDGVVTLREMPNVQQLDYVKRALQKFGGEVDNLGKPTYEAVGANDLARKLRDTLSDAVPSYKRALELGGDKIAMDNALDLGRKLMRPNITREAVVGATKGMTKAEQLNFKIGIRAALDEKLANVKRTISDPNVDAREAMSAIKEFSSRAAREKLEAVLGKMETEAFLKSVDQAANAFALRAAVTQNSKTFARDYARGVIEEKAGGGAMRAITEGRPVAAAQGLVQQILETTPAARRQEIQGIMEDVVDLLTSNQGAEAVTRLRQLEAAAETPEAAAAIRRAITRIGVSTSPVAGEQGGELLRN